MTECKLNASCGKLNGIVVDEARIFKGIPYAITNRFEYPKPYPQWKNEFDATQSGTDCYQRSSFPNLNYHTNEFYEKEFPSVKKYFYGDSPMCLNVITPLEADNCPVVIFFHGGGHEIGKFDELPFGTSTEYAKRGIILVSVGYRLNIFSLFNGQNYGLYDMLESINWVKKHIESFGGDANSITLMGQSSGAMSIMSLTYGDKLKGLIKGAILLSGGGVIPKVAGPIFAKDAKDFWSEIEKKANAEDIDDLKKADPQILWYCWKNEVDKAKNSINLLQPEIDGDVIPDLPQKIIKQGTDLDFPAIISVTSQDMFPVVMYNAALKYAKRNAKSNRSPIYGAFFDRNIPGDRYRAFHAGDLWYTFGNMGKSSRPFTEIDKLLSKVMIDYYSNFIRTGNPNGKDLPEWKSVSKTNSGFRLFDGKSSGHIKPISCYGKTLYSMLYDKGPM